MSRLKDSYQSKLIQDLSKDLNIKNVHALPRLQKIVINVGVGQSKTNAKFMDTARETLKSITGQQPAPRVARKAIAGFKTRIGDVVGLVVTLRGNKMYDFADKLANIVFPRMRDFRGLDPKNFDKDGNYTIGIAEQIIFPEITHEKAEVLHGMSITLVSSAKNPEQGTALIKALGFPFKKEGEMKGING